MATLQSNSDRQAVDPHKETIRYVTGFQAAAAVATVGGLLILRPMRVRSLSLGVNDAGSANTTTVQAHLNGSAITGVAVSIGNAAANNTVANIGCDVALVAGDRFELVVSAISTAATDLAITAELVESY